MPSSVQSHLVVLIKGAILSSAMVWCGQLSAANFVYATNCCVSGSSISAINNAAALQEPGIAVNGTAVAVTISADGTRAYAITQQPNTLAALDPYALSAVATLKLAGAPQRIALAPDASTAYIARCAQSGVSGCQTGAVDVVQLPSLTLAASISVPQGSVRGLAIDASGGHLYVTTASVQQFSLTGVVSIDTSLNTVDAFLPFSKFSLGDLVILPFTSTAYIADIAAAKVHVIDLNTGQSIATIRLASVAKGLALSPDALKLYVSASLLISVSTITNTVLDQTYIAPLTAGIALSPDGSQCYISDYFESTLDTFDFASGQVTARVPTGFRPVAAAVTPDGITTLVAASGSSTISQIDEVTNKVQAEAEAGSEPYTIEVSPDGQFIYAINTYSSNVSIITADTFQRQVNIPTGYIPKASVLSPDGSRLYVSAFDATITVIDTAAQQVVGKILTAPSGSTAAYGMAISSDGKWLYALTDYGSFRGILIIETRSGNVLQQIPIVGDMADIAVSAEGAAAYISGNSNQAFLIVVDLVKGAQVAPLICDPPFGVKISPDGGFLYTGSQNPPSIFVINRASQEVISQTPVAGVERLALNAKGTRLYATGPLLSVFDTLTRKPIAFVYTGGPTLGVAAQ